jgi:hypothetical protein
MRHVLPTLLVEPTFFESMSLSTKLELAYVENYSRDPQQIGAGTHQLQANYWPTETSSDKTKRLFRSQFARQKVTGPTICRKIARCSKD